MIVIILLHTAKMSLFKLRLQWHCRACRGIWMPETHPRKNIIHSSLMSPDCLTLDPRLEISLTYIKQNITTHRHQDKEQLLCCTKVKCMYMLLHDKIHYSNLKRPHWNNLLCYFKRLAKNSVEELLLSYPVFEHLRFYPSSCGVPHS